MPERMSEYMPYILPDGIPETMSEQCVWMKITWSKVISCLFRLFRQNIRYNIAPPKTIANLLYNML